MTIRLVAPFVLAVAGARPPPVVPAVGAIASGKYRNVFVEAGYAPEEVDARVNATVKQLLFGNPLNESLLYPAIDGSNALYIWDVGDGDVRTEGMSYGMMAAVQLDLHGIFDRLLSWWKRFMQHTQETVSCSCFSMRAIYPLDDAPLCRILASATRRGTVKRAALAWTQTPPRTVKRSLSRLCFLRPRFAQVAGWGAIDGVTTVASPAVQRWGDGGAWNYTAEASLVLRAALGKEAPPCGPQGCQSVVNMWGGYADPNPALVVFVPYASGVSPPLSDALLTPPNAF